jgi:hypothetical protein
MGVAICTGRKLSAVADCRPGGDAREAFEVEGEVDVEIDVEG